MPEQTRGPAFELYRRVLQEVALRGWTKSELRQKTGVARSTVEGWAAQPRPPQPRTVNAVADALGIPREEALRLAGIIGEMPAREELDLSDPDEFERAALATDRPYPEKAAAIRRHRELLAELGLEGPPELLRRAVRRMAGEPGAASDERRGA